jgi:peptidoglycan hydrolase-like protein with peptidoglycan-binding domain
MKLNNNVLLIGGAAIVAGAYLVYKKSKQAKSVTTELDIAKKQMIEQSEIIKAEKKAAIKEATNSLQNPNSVKSKIALIQRSIGVNPDGIVGPQTLNKLKTFFPLLVNLTSANIEKIYTFVKANQYVTPTAKVVTLDYGSTMQTPLIVPNNNSGVNVFTDTFKPF